jgi:hypothetical protein
MVRENVWNLNQHLRRSRMKISKKPVHKNICNDLLFVGVKGVIATVIYIKDQ